MGLEFKPGDVVALKSGGPPMTICEADEGAPCQYDCRWFRADGTYEGDRFRAATLRLLASDATEFGIPEALVAAKDAQAEALKAERERQWEEDQVRYAHTTGYTMSGPAAGVTRDDHG